MHFQRHSSLIRTWAPKGEQPRIPSASTREKVAFFGAVNLKTGRLLTQEAAIFNGQTFGDFVSYFLRHTQGTIHMILDNASFHRSKNLKAFFAENRERLVRIFLPPYSPELNPIERVWRITRRQVTHNRYFASVPELRLALTSHFANLIRPNRALKVLCANI